MSLLTIGLPVYNAEDFLEDCIQSILNQTYKNFKLLIIDDGSTDDSLSIIKQFDDPRIELIQDGQNEGLPARLNQIAQLADTKYLARMDADDIMHPERIDFQLKILEEKPQVDILCTNMYSIDRNNNIKGVRMPYDSTINENDLTKVNKNVKPKIKLTGQWYKK